MNIKLGWHKRKVNKQKWFLEGTSKVDECAFIAYFVDADGWLHSEYYESEEEFLRIWKLAK